MLALFKYVQTAWEEARGYLYEDLEHIEIAINRHMADTFDDNGDLLAGAIAGDPTKQTRYVANTGVNHGPKWDLINLVNGVKNRLAFSHLPQVAASTLLGRGSAVGAGNVESITLGSNLMMTGTVLDAPPIAAVITPDIDILTHPFMGNL